MNAQAYFGVNASCELAEAIRRDETVSDTTMRDAFAVLREVYNGYGLGLGIHGVWINDGNVTLVWLMGTNEARITVGPDGIRYTAYSRPNDYPIEGFTKAGALFKALE